jgi:hypothetical protein
MSKKLTPDRAMDLLCALANARYALEYWEREAHYAGRSPSWAQGPRHTGREMTEILRDQEDFMRGLIGVPASADTNPKGGDTK